MGYSYHRYLVASDDTIYRMASAAFDRLLTDPGRFRVPELASQRVRSAEVGVKILRRDAVAVVRTAYSVLVFDAFGRLDLGRLFAQQQARVETALSSVLGTASRDANIIEADTRFIARGGTWKPTKALAQVLDDAALGRCNLPRLQVHACAPAAKQ